MPTLTPTPTPITFCQGDSIFVIILGNLRLSIFPWAASGTSSSSVHLAYLTIKRWSLAIRSMYSPNVLDKFIFASLWVGINADFLTAKTFRRWAPDLAVFAAVLRIDVSCEVRGSSKGLIGTLNTITLEFRL
jgi:hypothetical protein